MTRTERIYYLVFGLYTLSGWFLAPVYALFLLNLGLDLFQINAVLATYLIAACIFEVPTGAFADVVGRKTSFVLSALVRMVAFGLYGFAHTFTDCLFAEFVDAIGSTLASGALDAWAIDGMRAEGGSATVERFFARAQMLMRSAIIIGGIASGYIAAYQFNLPWLVASAGFGCTAVVACFVMHEPPPTSHRRWRDVPISLGRTVRDGLRTVRTAPVLLLLCTLTLIGAFGIMPVRMTWQPRLQSVMPQGLWWMGWVWALLNLACVGGNALVPLLLVRVRREYVLCVTSLWRALMLAIAGTATGFFPALTGLLCEEIGVGLDEPIQQAWMNEHIGAEQRATVLSVRAMAFTLGGGAGLVCLGLVARDLGMATAWICSAIVVLLAAPGFVALGRLARRQPPAPVATIGTALPTLAPPATAP